MKRGRGRPRKILHSHHLQLAQEMVNFSNGKLSDSDHNLPEFFKIYMPSLCSEMLRIPPDFIEKFGGNIPPNCEIKRAWGVCCSWQVDMKRVNGYWFFEEGWPNFVEENSLREGDFLTFCYLGKSVFNVKIFSRNGCLKGTSRNSNGTFQSGSEENSETNEPKISRWGSSVGCINGNPCFSIILMKTHLNTGLVSVPLEFWRAHVEMSKRSSKEATLWVENDAWDVELVNSGDRVRFRRGGLKFLQDNSLKRGTLCTFQLIPNHLLSFKVTFST